MDDCCERTRLTDLCDLIHKDSILLIDQSFNRVQIHIRLFATLRAFKKDIPWGIIVKEPAILQKEGLPFNTACVIHAVTFGAGIICRKTRFG